MHTSSPASAAHRPRRPLALAAAVLSIGLSACGQPAPEDISPLDSAGELLTWASPITTARLQEVPDPRVANETLLSIVSSRVAVGERGHACSVCHYRDTAIAYRPDIDQYATSFIGPHDLVDGRTWSGADGWAERLLALGDEAHYEKPTYVRAVFARWLADGRKFKENLSWQAPVDVATLGDSPSPFVAGATLADVINDRVSARPDSLLCGECHYPGSEAAYRPPLPEDRGGDIGPHDVVDGRAWSGPNGWAERFIAHGPSAEVEKPAYLRDVFTVWLSDGGR